MSPIGDLITRRASPWISANGTSSAAHIINTTGTLDVLSCAGAPRHPTTRHLNLPSWVPDWHAHELSRPIYPLFSSTKTPQKFSVDPNADTLSLSGKILGEIDSLSDAILPAQDSIRRETCTSVLHHWSSATMTLEPSGEEVHLSTIISMDRLFADANQVVPGRMSLPSLQAHLFAGRRVFRRRGGNLGVAPPYASPGDHIALFKGASVPYVIRAAGEGKYRLIGECISSQLFGTRWEDGMCGEGEREVLIA